MVRYLYLAILVLFVSSPLFGQSISQQTHQQEKRIALVIGNGNYTSSVLPNPENDARSMAEVLKRLGFTVFKYENLNQAQMKIAIDDFGSKLKGYDVGLFFYAGHGIQSNGYNYLIPVDVQLQAEQDVEYDCVQADRILAKMEGSGTKVNIIILDACRNNPFERSWTRSATGRGLAFMNAPRGTLIAYATAPGTTASDGAGKNGLYTSAILESIQIPDITIIRMFQDVRNTVSQKSGNQQIPWESTSLTGDFYFNSSEVAKTEAQNNIKPELTNISRDNGRPDEMVDLRDNHRYKTVIIGSQVWMAENLSYDSGGGCWTYENNSSAAYTYGRLYDWVTAKLVCPMGWHLPDNEEWSTLTNFLGGDSIAGGKMKEKGTAHWRIPNTGATNETGFTAFPGGVRLDDGKFYGIWDTGRWWSATEESTHNASSILMIFDKSSAIRQLIYKKMAISVRCIKDTYDWKQ